MSNKRGRDDIEDDEVSMAAMELGSTLSRGLEMKIRALDRLRELIDRHDDLYVNQKALVDADCAFYLVELLQDESDAVALMAARVIASMTDHSAPAKVKLQSGPLIGLESSVSKVMLNPVQGEFIDAGAVPLLVAWLPLQAVQQKVDAALQALTNISSYNHEGKIAYLEGLVDVVASGKYQCLEHLDDLIDSLEHADETVLQLYEKVCPSMIQATRIPGQIGEKAVSVLGTLCEHAPELAKELRTTTPGGGLGGSSNSGVEVAGLVARHLLFGSLQAQDTASRTLWYLTLGEKEILGPDGPLASQIEAMAAALNSLVEKSAKEEEEEDAREDNRRSSRDYQDADNDGEDRMGGGVGDFSFGPGGLPVAEEVCFAEEAQLLLKALRACNPELKIESSESLDKGTSCCIM